MKYEIVHKLTERARSIVAEEAAARGYSLQSTDYTDRCDEVLARLVVEQTLSLFAPDPTGKLYGDAVNAAATQRIKQYFGLAR